MRVVILGAGLLGITSAYYLRQLGHEVTVVDRHAAPAAKARGSASQFEPRLIAALSEADELPAADPVVRRAANGRRRSSRAAAQLKKLRSRMQRRIGWLLDHTLGARPESRPLEQMVRLTAYSRANVRALRAEAGIPDSRVPGLLNLFTDAEAFERRLAAAPHWSRLGCEDQLFSPEQAIALEPALQDMAAKLAGAAYSMEDPARDPAEFAANMVFLCRAAGVRFMLSHTVVSLAERDGRISHVELLDPEGESVRLRAQAYVLALGASSVPHAEALDIHMPLRFVREYILNLPLAAGREAPRIALHDRQGKLRISRIQTSAGEQLRVVATVRASAAEEDEPDSDRFQAMLERVEQLLPGLCDGARAEFDTALHAVSRNRLPMIGKTRIPNLFLNTAPGTPDWVHVCGAGKSIARIVSGLRPELDFAFRRP